jgi:acetolactate synthase-1/2/3 large subunit
VVGGSGWSAASVASFAAFAEAWRLPVVTAFRRQDLFDNGSDLYVGTLALGTHPYVDEALDKADLLIVAGSGLDAMSRSALSRSTAPRRVLPAGDSISGHGDKLWGDWHRRFLDALDEGELAGPVRLTNTRLPDAIVTAGAGTFTLLAQRNWLYRRFPSQAAPQAGSMGYGVPAALAAKLAFPERPVVCVTGDGDFLMNGQELATAVQYGAPFLVLLVNNSSYGTIARHQDSQYPGRRYGVELRNPDFAAYARAFGADGEALQGDTDFGQALDRAIAAIEAGRPALIEMRVG